MGACTQTHLSANTHAHTHACDLSDLYTVLPLSCGYSAYTYCARCMTNCGENVHIAVDEDIRNTDGALYTAQPTYYLHAPCITTKKRHLRRKKKKWKTLPVAWWNEPQPLRVSCFLYLLRVFEMYGVDNSSNLNVMQNTLWNGSGCINTISCESYPPGTVNVLILQRLCHDKTISWIPMRLL